MEKFLDMLNDLRYLFAAIISSDKLHDMFVLVQLTTDFPTILLCICDFNINFKDLIIKALHS